MNPASQNELLNSWKEIAVYLNRGVRTVQRWETDLGLPVRRPRGMSRSAVIAMRPEIDDWLKNCPANQNGKTIGAERLFVDSGSPRLLTNPLIIQCTALRSDVCRNRAAMHVSLNKLMKTLEEMLGPRAAGF